MFKANSLANSLADWLLVLLCLAFNTFENSNNLLSLESETFVQNTSSYI